jgi:hypothetical protein
MSFHETWQVANRVLDRAGFPRSNSVRDECELIDEEDAAAELVEVERVCSQRFSSATPPRAVLSLPAVRRPGAPSRIALRTHCG